MILKKLQEEFEKTLEIQDAQFRPGKKEEAAEWLKYANSSSDHETLMRQRAYQEGFQKAMRIVREFGDA